MDLYTANYFKKQLQCIFFFFLNGRGVQDYFISLINSLLVFVIGWLIFRSSNSLQNFCPLCWPSPRKHSTYLLWWKTPFRAPPCPLFPSFLPSVLPFYFSSFLPSFFSSSNIFWIRAMWQTLGSIQRNKTIKKDDTVPSRVVYRLIGKGYKIDNYVHKSTSVPAMKAKSRELWEHGVKTISS